MKRTEGFVPVTNELFLSDMSMTTNSDKMILHVYTELFFTTTRSFDVYRMPLPTVLNVKIRGKSVSISFRLLLITSSRICDIVLIMRMIKHWYGIIKVLMTFSDRFDLWHTCLCLQRSTQPSTATTLTREPNAMPIMTERITLYTTIARFKGLSQSDQSFVSFSTHGYQQSG